VVSLVYDLVTGEGLDKTKGHFAAVHVGGVTGDKSNLFKLLQAGRNGLLGGANGEKGALDGARIGEEAAFVVGIV
jgi:hypothetical protein